MRPVAVADAVGELLRGKKKSGTVTTCVSKLYWAYLSKLSGMWIEKFTAKRVVARGRPGGADVTRLQFYRFERFSLRGDDVVRLESEFRILARRRGLRVPLKGGSEATRAPTTLDQFNTIDRVTSVPRRDPRATFVLIVGRPRSFRSFRVSARPFALRGDLH